MTRTARAGFPKAMMRDRSESRSGLDKSMRKNGGGGHNWGSLADERDHEFAALDDDAVALQVTAEEVDDDAASVKSDTSMSFVLRLHFYLTPSSHRIQVLRRTRRRERQEV